MYGKIKIAGHPAHPMLVALPVTCYTGALADLANWALGCPLATPPRWRTG